MTPGPSSIFAIGAKLLKGVLQVTVLPDRSCRAHDELNDAMQNAGTIGMQFFTASIWLLHLDIAASSMEDNF